MLSLLKRVLAQCKSIVVKMHFDYVKSKYARENFELSCDQDLILGLPCVMPILEVGPLNMPKIGCVYHGHFGCDKSY